ncbi:hypothetical protein [Sulfuricystis multivorans]|uniref:hypothetical protein n=1 Tax=Sulfuricystis multivorans TaxID=2211108 RepID=UPI000F82E7C8|nr:hypothetical protein [Sulfuricystis multivorans]
MNIESVLLYSAFAGDLLMIGYGIKKLIDAIGDLRNRRLSPALWGLSKACALFGLGMLLPSLLVYGALTGDNQYRELGKMAIVVSLLAIPSIPFLILKKWFRLQAIVLASFGLVTAIAFSVDGSFLWAAFFIVGSIAALYEGRQKPIEQRKPTVAWMVVHGLWDQLEKEGLPADEIERLKKLTPEERERLMAFIRRPQIKSQNTMRRRSSGYSIYGDDIPSLYDGRW